MTERLNLLYSCGNEYSVSNVDNFTNYVLSEGLENIPGLNIAPLRGIINFIIQHTNAETLPSLLVMLSSKTYIGQVSIYFRINLINLIRNNDDTSIKCIQNPSKYFFEYTRGRDLNLSGDDVTMIKYIFQKEIAQMSKAISDSMNRNSDIAKIRYYTPYMERKEFKINKGVVHFLTTNENHINIYVEPENNNDGSFDSLNPTPYESLSLRELVRNLYIDTFDKTVRNDCWINMLKTQIFRMELILYKNSLDLLKILKYGSVNVFGYGPENAIMGIYRNPDGSLNYLSSMYASDTNRKKAIGDTNIFDNVKFNRDPVKALPAFIPKVDLSKEIYDRADAIAVATRKTARIAGTYSDADAEELANSARKAYIERAYIEHENAGMEVELLDYAKTQIGSKVGDKDAFIPEWYQKSRDRVMDRKGKTSIHERQNGLYDNPSEENKEFKNMTGKVGDHYTEMGKTGSVRKFTKEDILNIMHDSDTFYSYMKSKVESLDDRKVRNIRSELRPQTFDSLVSSAGGIDHLDKELKAAYKDLRGSLSRQDHKNKGDNQKDNQNQQAKGQQNSGTPGGSTPPTDRIAKSGKNVKWVQYWEAEKLNNGIPATMKWKEAQNGTKAEKKAYQKIYRDYMNL